MHLLWELFARPVCMTLSRCDSTRTSNLWYESCEAGACSQSTHHLSGAQELRSLGSIAGLFRTRRILVLPYTGARLVS